MCPSRIAPMILPLPVELITARLQSSAEVYMESIRSFEPPSGALAAWFFGQNGFLLKEAGGPLIGVDLYLTDSCAGRFANLPYRLNRPSCLCLLSQSISISTYFRQRILMTITRILKR